MEIELNGKNKKIKIEYKIKKNISISIEEDEIILVRAPIGISHSEIKNILLSKSKSIEKKLKNIENNKNIWNRNTSEDENTFKLFGEDISFQEANIKKKEDLKELYLRELENMLKFLLEKYSKLMGVKYNSFKINNVKSNWGTCNSKGELTFNLKLVVAPVKVIEYVVVHELSHLKYMNHSKDFWLNVEKYMPEYKKEKIYLKDFGRFMNI